MLLTVNKFFHRKYIAGKLYETNWMMEDKNAGLHEICGHQMGFTMFTPLLILRIVMDLKER